MGIELTIYFEKEGSRDDFTWAYAHPGTDVITISQKIMGNESQVYLNRQDIIAIHRAVINNEGRTEAFTYSQK